MFDTAHLFIIGVLLVTCGFGMGTLISMARLLGEAQSTTREIGQILERIEASTARIAEMTREVLRRTS
jgi:hypothetical protein